MIVTEISMRLARSANEKQTSVAVTTSSAATTLPVGSDVALIYSTVECFAVANDNPTATVAAGTPIPAGALVRVSFNKGDKIAFIAASGSGTAYIRPDA